MAKERPMVFIMTRRNKVVLAVVFTAPKTLGVQHNMMPTLINRRKLDKRILINTTSMLNECIGKIRDIKKSLTKVTLKVSAPLVSLNVLHKSRNNISYTFTNRKQGCTEDLRPSKSLPTLINLGVVSLPFTK